MQRTIIIAFLILIAVILPACDEWKEIEIDNRSNETLDILYAPNTGPARIGTSDPVGGCVLCELPGMSVDSFLGPNTSERHDADRWYEITARETTSNIIIYSRVFTWDELKDMDWRVVITDMRE